MRALMLPISGLMSANFHSEDEQARLRDDILLTADGPASALGHRLEHRHIPTL